MNPLGVHWLGKLHGCAHQDRLCSLRALQPWCLESIADSGLTIVGNDFHQFADAGITGAVLLAESHFTVHTWPELGLVTLDLFVCNHRADNSACADELWSLLTAGFAPERVDQQRLLR